MRSVLPAPLRSGALALIALTSSPGLQACATCFGRSDSALAEGMNLGILSLLGVILTVLTGFAAFIVYLARRSALLAAGRLPEAAVAAKTVVS